MNIIDRRLNPGGKSFANRQRFLRRARAQVRKAVREASSSRSIKDAGKGGEVSIPAGGVHEPHLRRSGQGGVRDYVLPGNKKYIEGDSIARPPQGGGQGSKASDSGDGEDEFRFALSDEEYLDLYLEDLELPDLAKRQVTGAKSVQWRQAGYSISGPPSRISVPRTLRHSMSRRIALKRPKKEEISALREQIEKLEREGGHFDELVKLRKELEQVILRSKRIPYIDPVDVRYRRLGVESEADRQGGDVLPDGRVRLDERAHEGFGQAVLFAALSVLEPPLRARGCGVHPSYARSF